MDSKPCQIFGRALYRSFVVYSAIGVTEFFTNMDILMAVSKDLEVAKSFSKKHTIRTLFIFKILLDIS